MKTAVTIVCNQIIPYRIPVFDTVAAHPDIDLEVVYLSKAEKNRQWKVDERLKHKHVLLPSVSTYVSSRDWPIHLHWGLTDALDAHAPRVVVTMGYDSFAFWQAGWWARRNGAARVLYFGSTAFSSRTRDGVIQAMRRRFVHDTDAFLAYGSWARDYLLSLGARWDDIFLGMNTVDVKSFARITDRATPIERRRSHELLYIGQLIARKGVDTVVKALYRLPHRDFRLHVVGNGPDEEFLRRLVESRDMQENVVFHGYKQKNELAAFFAGCDTLVMPSHREVWGLVVNEALAAGLFVVAGQQAGCVPDLIKPGVNGLTVDTKDEAHMAEVLERAMGVTKNRAEIRESVMKYTPEHTGSELIRAIAHARDKRAGIVWPMAA